MNATKPISNYQTLAISAAIGAAIAFAIICIFVFGVDKPHPAWGENWRVRPLLLTPLAGMAGGIVFHYIRNFRAKTAAMRLLLTFMATFAFLIALWMGIVLGLDGTMWN